MSYAKDLSPTTEEDKLGMKKIPYLIAMLYGAPCGVTFFKCMTDGEFQ